MITIPAQNIKRPGIGEKDDQTMMEDLALARVESSEADVRSGRTRTGSATDLMKELGVAESD